MGVVERALALRCRPFFHQYYLDPLRKPPKHQVKLFEFLDANKRGLVLFPRGHLKSTTVAFSFPIQELARDPNKRILIIQETDKTAKKTLRQIRNELRFNNRLKEDFGFRLVKDTENMIYLRRPLNLKDPSVECVGVEGSITGGHYDIIILDDILSLENTMTVHRRERIKEWFEGTVYQMSDQDTKIYFIGTRKHFDDLYARLIKSGLWSVYLQKAIIKYPVHWDYERDEDGFITGIKDLEGEYEVLWPEGRPIERLLIDKVVMGSASFNREMMNEPVSTEDAVFKKEWLKYFSGEVFKPKALFAAIDPAISTNKGADYFSLVFLYVGDDNNFYLDRYVHEHLEFPEQVKKIKEALDFGHSEGQPFFRMVAESNFYQKSLVQQLAREDSRPIIPVHNSKNKEARILSLAPFFEAGRVFIREGMDAFELEFLQFPKGEHDDLLDALEMCVRQAVALQRGGRRFKLV